MLRATAVLNAVAAQTVLYKQAQHRVALQCITSKAIGGIVIIQLLR